MPCLTAHTRWRYLRSWLGWWWWRRWHRWCWWWCRWSTKNRLRWCWWSRCHRWLHWRCFVRHLLGEHRLLLLGYLVNGTLRFLKRNSILENPSTVWLVWSFYLGRTSECSVQSFLLLCWIYLMRVTCKTWDSCENWLMRHRVTNDAISVKIYLINEYGPQFTRSRIDCFNFRSRLIKFGEK